MERVLPGEPLKIVADDDQVTRVAITVMQRLLKPAPAQHFFPTVADWVGDLKNLRARFSGGCGAFPAIQVKTLLLLHPRHHRGYRAGPRSQLLARDDPPG